MRPSSFAVALGYGTWGGVGCCILGHDGELTAAVTAFQLQCVVVDLKRYGLFGNLAQAVHQCLGRYAELSCSFLLQNRQGGYIAFLRIACSNLQLTFHDLQEETVQYGHGVLTGQNLAGTCDTAVQSRARYFEIHML